MHICKNEDMELDTKTQDLYIGGSQTKEVFKRSKGSEFARASRLYSSPNLITSSIRERDDLINMTSTRTF